MNRFQAVAVTAILTVLIVGIGNFAARNHEIVPSASAQSPHTAPAIAVQTVLPAVRDVSRLITLPGDVRPWEEANLNAKSAGYLAAITVDKGDHVHAGQLLATLSAPELHAERDQADGNYRSALAAEEGSRVAGARLDDETARAGVSVEKARAERLEAAAAVVRARAQQQQAEASVRQAESLKGQAQATLDEDRARITRAQADQDSASADEHLASVTYDRLRGIYEKNSQLIARQDVDTAEARYRSAQGRLTAARAEVKATQAHLAAARAAFASADTQIDEAHAQRDASQSQVEIAQAHETATEKAEEVARYEVVISRKQRAIAGARLQETTQIAQASGSARTRATEMANYLEIRAPFNGTVTRRYVDRGAFIQSASGSQNAQPVVTIANMDRLRLTFYVPELEAHFVRVGTPVKIALSTARDVAIAAKVARTAGALDPKTRSLLTEVDLPNPDGAILPGSYVVVRAALETHPHVVSVPSLAVAADKSGKYLFVVVDGKAKRAPIVPGFDDGAYTEILSGLTGQETVIVTGRDNLTPNAPVAPTPWSPPTK